MALRSADRLADDRTWQASIARFSSWVNEAARAVRRRGPVRPSRRVAGGGVQQPRPVIEQQQCVIGDHFEQDGYVADADQDARLAREPEVARRRWTVGPPAFRGDPEPHRVLVDLAAYERARPTEAGRVLLRTVPAL